jgi:hypothetical protein
LHRHLGRAPDEGQQLLRHGALGELLEMERPLLAAEDVERGLQERHGALLYHKTRRWSSRARAEVTGG